MSSSYNDAAKTPSCITIAMTAARSNNNKHVYISVEVNHLATKISDPEKKAEGIGQDGFLLI